jgi:hypothetical protein
VISLPPAYAPLVRMNFSDDATWSRVVRECTAPNVDGFAAAVTPVDDPALEGSDWTSLRDAALRDDADRGSVLFVVDAITLASADHPVLVVSISRYYAEHHPDEFAAQQPFRCIPAELWAPENNLNLANLDWRDFAEAVDADGVFRGH